MLGQLPISQEDGWRRKVLTGKMPEVEPGQVPSMHMNEAGITLRHGKYAGRLLRAARYYAGGNVQAEWPNLMAAARRDRLAIANEASPQTDQACGSALVVERS